MGGGRKFKHFFFFWGAKLNTIFLGLERDIIVVTAKISAIFKLKAPFFQTLFLFFLPYLAKNG